MAAGTVQQTQPHLALAGPQPTLSLVFLQIPRACPSPAGASLQAHSLELRRCQHLWKSPSETQAVTRNRLQPFVLQVDTWGTFWTHPRGPPPPVATLCPLVAFQLTLLPPPSWHHSTKIPSALTSLSQAPPRGTQGKNRLYQERRPPSETEGRQMSPLFKAYEEVHHDRAEREGRR